MIPTTAVSPSSNAFTACVVLCATSETPASLTAGWASSVFNTCTTPCATPSGAVCVVGMSASANNAYGCVCTATALVNVPPTSTPRRSLVIGNPPHPPSPSPGDKDRRQERGSPKHSEDRG